MSVEIDGVKRKLRLTFGALAEIETGLSVGDLGELGVRLGKLNGAEMMEVLAALLRGAGEDASAIAEARVDLREVSSAIARVFREAVG